MPLTTGKLLIRDGQKRPKCPQCQIDCTFTVRRHRLFSIKRESSETALQRGLFSGSQLFARQAGSVSAGLLNHSGVKSSNSLLGIWR